MNPSRCWGRGPGARDYAGPRAPVSELSAEPCPRPDHIPDQGPHLEGTAPGVSDPAPDAEHVDSVVFSFDRRERFIRNHQTLHRRAENPLSPFIPTAGAVDFLAGFCNRQGPCNEVTRPSPVRRFDTPWGTPQPASGSWRLYLVSDRSEALSGMAWHEPFVCG